MNKGFKIAYRVLVLLVLLATFFSWRAEQEAQGKYLALHERCLNDYEQLPAEAEPDAEWSRRCALEDTSSELNGAMRALDAAQKPFLASAVACVVLLLLMAAVYFLQRLRKS